MAYQQQTIPSPGGQVINAVKFVADQALMPGSSLLVEGKVVDFVTAEEEVGEEEIRPGREGESPSGKK